MGKPWCCTFNPTGAISSRKTRWDGTLSKILSPGRKFLKRFAKTRIRRKEGPSANGSWRRERNSRTSEGRKRMLPKSKRINRRISTDDFVAIRNFFFRFASGLVDCFILLKKEKKRGKFFFLFPQKKKKKKKKK